MRTDELEMALRDDAADQPPVNGDLAVIVRRVRHRQRRRRTAAAGLFALLALASAGSWWLLSPGEPDSRVASSGPHEPEVTTPPTSEPAPAPDDPVLDEYRAAVADTVGCLEDLGYYVIGPWPHPDGKQYGYAYGLLEGSGAPELQAAAERCYEMRELDAHNAMVMRDGPAVGLQEELLDVLNCVRPHSEVFSGAPSTLAELQALDAGVAARLSGDLEGVLADIRLGRIAGSEALTTCIQEASALPR